MKRKTKKTKFSRVRTLSFTKQVKVVATAFFFPILWFSLHSVCVSGVFSCDLLSSYASFKAPFHAWWRNSLRRWRCRAALRAKWQWLSSATSKCFSSFRCPTSCPTKRCTIGCVTWSVPARNANFRARSSCSTCTGSPKRTAFASWSSNRAARVATLTTHLHQLPHLPHRLLRPPFRPAANTIHPFESPAKSSSSSRTPPKSSSTPSLSVCCSRPLFEPQHSTIRYRHLDGPGTIAQNQSKPRTNGKKKKKKLCCLFSFR